MWLFNNINAYTCITQFAFPSYQLLLLNLIWMLIGYGDLKKMKKIKTKFKKKESKSDWIYPKQCLFTKRSKKKATHNKKTKET